MVRQSEGCVLWQPGVSLPVLKEELGPGRDVPCVIQQAVISFFQEKRNLHFYIKFSPFLKHGGACHCLFAASGLDALRQKESRAGHTAVPRGARDRWLLFSRARNSQDLSAWADPVELLHRLCFPVCPALTLLRAQPRARLRPGLPVTWWRSQERTHTLPLAVPSSSSPPERAQLCARRPSKYIAPGLAGENP